MNSQVAAIGYLSEKTFAHATKKLQENGLLIDIIDLGVARTATDLAIEAFPGNLRLHMGEQTFELADYSAFFQRCYFSDLGRPEISKFMSDLVCEINGFLATCSAFVINRPCSPEINGSKLAHLAVLSSCGFVVPTSYLLSEPEVAKKVVRPDQQWISKGCSGQRTEVSIVDVSSYMRMDSIRLAPVLFQRRIKGPNVRTHRVGKNHISLKIESDGIDYRYAENNEFEIIDTPESVAVAMAQYCAVSQLDFVGFDFRIDEVSCQWVCLEANPMPGYDYYDRRCQGAVSQLLAKAMSLQGYSAETFADLPTDHPSGELFIDVSRRRAVNRP